jgi:aprataxin
MKTKKHYNSFRTDLGFFVHLSDVEEWIESDGRIVSQTLVFMMRADGSLYLAMKF